MIDRISLLGLIVGLGAIVGGQALEGGRIAALAQPAAFLIVIGGTFGATMLQSPLPVFLRGLRMGLWAFSAPSRQESELIGRLVGWSQLARREGLLSLEPWIQREPDRFIRKGLQLLVDGADSGRLREVMQIEIDSYGAHLRQAARIWEAAAGYAPTIGILGAVLGLIHVMENLTDPSRLGAGIAVAFVATIYGVGCANLVFLPMARKILGVVADQVNQRHMLVDGLAAIADGDNPRIVESRLNGYLHHA